MIRLVLYALWGVAVLAGLGWAQATGWTFSAGRTAQVAPQSVRDNPGAYRSPYYVPGRILRGK